MSLLALVSVHPEDFGTFVCTGKNPGGYEQEIGKAVQVTNGFRIDVFIAGQGNHPAFSPAANGSRQVTARC